VRPSLLVTARFPIPDSRFPVPDSLFPVPCSLFPQQKKFGQVLVNSNP
ncbi:MAG: hypothetical protein F6K49_38470, partial [Moorea sp. SIO3I6]|nr:hypothetical protein [Moorena sp. SIO3I6]